MLAITPLNIRPRNGDSGSSNSSSINKTEADSVSHCSTISKKSSLSQSTFRFRPSCLLSRSHTCPCLSTELPAPGRKPALQWSCLIGQQGTYSLKSVNLLVDVLQNSVQVHSLNPKAFLSKDASQSLYSLLQDAQVYARVMPRCHRLLKLATQSPEL